MFTQLLHFVQSHPEYAYILGFSITFMESIPLLGHFLPGFMTVPPFGWLIAQHILPFYTIMYLFFGSLLGDIFSFSVGYFNQGYVRSKLMQSHYKGALRVIDTMMQNYGAYTVIIGRFSGPLRSFVPLVSGLFRMQPRFFVINSVIAIILWLGIHLLPGFLLSWYHLEFSQHTEIVTDVCSLLAFISLAVIIACHAQISRMLMHTFSLSASVRPLLSSAIYFICYFLMFINALACLFYGSFAAINQYTYSLLTAMHSSYGLTLAVYFTVLGEVEYLSILSILVSLYLYRKKQFYSFSVLALAFCYAFGFCSLVKIVVHYPRPEHVSSFLSAYSFPSGHVALSTMLGYCLLFTKLIKRNYANHIFVNTVILFIALSRVYLGAHWLLDIAAGWLIGMMSYHFAMLLISFLPSFCQYNCKDVKLIPIPLLFTAYAVIAFSIAYLTNSLSFHPYQLI